MCRTLQTRARRYPAIAVVVAGLLVGHTLAHGVVEYDLIELGNLSGGLPASVATAINDAGVVVGYSDSAKGLRAYRWESTQGMTELDTLSGSAGQSAALAISDAGLVVGRSSDGERGSRALVWTASGVGREMSDGATPTAGHFIATGVNAAGWVVGWSRTEAGTQPFIWTETAGLRRLERGTGEAISGMAHGINATGLIVGARRSADGIERAFVWDPESGLRDLGALEDGLGASVAYAVNGAGTVVGSADVATGRRAVAWYPTMRMRDLGDLEGGEDASVAFGINDAGQIVGRSSGTLGNSAFLWDPAHGLRDLNRLVDPDLGWTVREARSINRAGQIAAWGYKAGTGTRALLLVPRSRDVPRQ
ncbi:MAG: DUF3466 family protein [Steroidobacteraceae bacterium]|nr:DUF3466 family protein [Steroidobacteraceae bacterium]